FESYYIYYFLFLSECKVWRNPLNLFRGAEYSRYTWVTGKEPLTYYDMNLSAQDHQTFFLGDTQQLRPEDSVMQKAWRERNPQARIQAAYQAIEMNLIFKNIITQLNAILFFIMCIIKMMPKFTSYVLLAEEEATTITEAERLFKQALKSGMKLSHSGKDTNLVVYIKRRLAMCARKLGRIKEAVKMMRDLMKEFPLLGMLNIHENLLEALLELQAYADVQAVLAKYDDISLPKSATICYTSALLKARAVSDKFSPEAASRRGLSTAEMNAVEAIHRAVEFNPHVPKVRMILLKGPKFHTAVLCIVTTFHEVSVYPKKELPFFILFTAGLCSFCAMLAMLTHQFPELMGVFVKAFFSTLFAPLGFFADKMESFMPSCLWHQLANV
uniref:Suppression of tumorigenicity 7 like n=1 Tax=Sinocyclocheilus grahami TaxID=75366 RepID=A0A672R010_SINGR